ncbi:MAG: hypothetical protein AB1478_03605 [Nitrospirota bacterium]|jgi:hypothetical protein
MDRQTTPWHVAKEIMGDRAMGIELSIQAGIPVAKDFSAVPYSSKELEGASLANKLLVAIPRITLLSLRQRFPSVVFQSKWYLNQKFALDESRMGYHLLTSRVASTVEHAHPELTQAVYSPELVYVASMLILADMPPFFQGWSVCRDESSDHAKVFVAARGNIVYLPYLDDIADCDQITITESEYRN